MEAVKLPKVSIHRHQNTGSDIANTCVLMHIYDTVPNELCAESGSLRHRTPGAQLAPCCSASNNPPSSLSQKMPSGWQKLSCVHPWLLPCHLKTETKPLAREGQAGRSMLHPLSCPLPRTSHSRPLLRNTLSMYRLLFS